MKGFTYKKFLEINKILCNPKYELENQTLHFATSGGIHGTDGSFRPWNGETKKAYEKARKADQEFLNTLLEVKECKPT